METLAFASQLMTILYNEVPKKIAMEKKKKKKIANK